MDVIKLNVIDRDGLVIGTVTARPGLTTTAGAIKAVDLEKGALTIGNPEQDARKTYTAEAGTLPAVNRTHLRDSDRLEMPIAKGDDPEAKGKPVPLATRAGDAATTLRPR